MPTDENQNTYNKSFEGILRNKQCKLNIPGKKFPSLLRICTSFDCYVTVLPLGRCKMIRSVLHIECSWLYYLGLSSNSLIKLTANICSWSVIDLSGLCYLCNHKRCWVQACSRPTISKPVTLSLRVRTIKGQTTTTYLIHMAVEAEWRENITVLLPCIHMFES